MSDFIISDVHYPFQDDAAVNVMLRMQQYYKPKHVIINGDFLDCVSLSRFSKEPQEPGAFRAQITGACDILRKLQKYSKIVMVEGNHEARLSKYINDNAPALHGLISIEQLLARHLKKKIEYVRTTPGESMRKWDDLLIGHFQKASKNTCYTVKLLVEKYMTNVVQAHTHRLGEYAISGYNGILRGWECGCLCDLDPSYVASPNWQQGFLVYTGNQDMWNIEISHINDGKAMFRGKVFIG